MDPSLVEKYRKVRALATGGATEGERAAARKVLASMEARYPGISVASIRPSSPPIDGSFGFPPGGASEFRPSGKSEPPPREGGGFVDSVFDWLREAAAGVREGMDLRQRVLDAINLDSTVNTRTMKITLSIPLTELDGLLTDFGDKDAEIATILGSVVRDEFIATLSSMTIEDDDG
jgi:hypothetical protein